MKSPIFACLYVTIIVQNLIKLNVMKRLFSFLTIVLFSTALWSQNVFTVVYAVSDDGFVNVRQSPSMSGKVVAKLWMFSHGLGSGVLRGQSGKWSKVSVGNVTGWAYSKYVGSQNWYDGTGSSMIVANKPRTVIYGENFADDAAGLPVFSWVEKGTIIADNYEEDGEYYMLRTAHDNLFIKKSDVRVVRR